MNEELVTHQRIANPLGQRAGRPRPYMLPQICNPTLPQPPHVTADL